MHDLPKPLRRKLRESASRAHAEELRRALLPLADDFDRWRRGELDPFELSDRIHEFHDGPARDLWKRYVFLKPDTSVPYAIAAGILEADQLPPELLDRFALAISFFREQLVEEPAGPQLAADADDAT